MDPDSVCYCKNETEKVPLGEQCIPKDIRLVLALVRAGHVQTFLKSFRSVLERGPSARLFRSRSFFSIVPFLFHSFTNRSNIFKNAFYAFVFFLNDGIVLDRSVRSRERTIVPQERRPALPTIV